jgi:hypothetical protein
LVTRGGEPESPSLSSSKEEGKMPGQGDAPETMAEQIRTIGQRIDVVEGQIKAAIASGTDTAELKTQLGVLEAQMQAAQADQKAAQKAAQTNVEPGRQ